MTFQPSPRHRCQDITLTPWSDFMAPMASASTQPSTTTWSVANLARFYPIYLLEPFTVAKAFWLNGAIPGLGDSYDIGVYQMTDMATGRCDLLRSTGPVYSGGAPNVVQEAGWPQAVIRNVLLGNSSTDATSYTTAVVALAVGKTYILSVANSKAAAADVVSSIDNGPTFTSRGSQAWNASTANRVSLWTAVPATNYTGTLVINFGANTQTACVWSLEEVSGVDTASADGIVQIVTASGNTTTPTVTLAAFGSAYNATYFACSSLDTTTTPKTGFAELGDGSSSAPVQALETQWAAQNDTTPNGTITSGEWGAIGIEIKANTSVPSQPWRIARANLTASFSDTDASTYATASVTLKAGKLYLLSVENTHGTSASAVSAITGGPTFTSRSTTQFNGTLNRTSIWSCVPTSDYVGTLTIEFGGTTQTSCIWSLNEFSGVDTTTDDGIVQAATNTGNSANVSVSLAAFGSSANTTFETAASVNGAGSHIGSAGMSQLSVGTSTAPVARMSTEARHDDVRNPGTAVGTSQWGACAVEIKADTSPFVIPPSMPGNPNIYMGFAASAALASLFLGQPAIGQASAAGMLQLTSAFPLPSTVTPVAPTGAARRPLAGFSLRALIG